MSQFNLTLTGWTRPLAAIRLCQSTMSAVIQLAATPHCYLFISNQIIRRSGCKKVLLPNSETAKPKAWDDKATPLQLLPLAISGWPCWSRARSKRSWKLLIARKSITFT